MFSLIVFDLDGTLIDSRRDIADAANAVLQSTGAPPLDQEAIGAMVGDGAAALIARAFAAAGRPAPPDALERFLAAYGRGLLTHTRPYPGISDALDSLSSRVPLALLTNKPIAATRTILDALDLARFFPRDRVLGGDGPFARKPAPDGLLRLAEDAGAEPGRTLLVGDSIVDWQTAHDAGARICLARYGFGFATFPADRLTDGDRWIDTAEELKQL